MHIYGSRCWLADKVRRLDVLAVRTWRAVQAIPVRLDRLEQLIMATEQETREALTSAITNTLSYVDRVTAERDQYRDALATADADKAAAVAAALDAESADDVTFLQGEVERLRGFQPEPAPQPEPEQPQS